MIASHTGNATVVTQLLSHGAAHGAAESSLGQTALMRAVVENHVDVVRTLLAAGADARARSKNRFTPLLFAAQQGNIEIARLLLAAGADVNEAAPDGIAGDTNAARSFKPDTEAAALLVAIDSQHEAMATFLLEQRRQSEPERGRQNRAPLRRATGDARAGQGAARPRRRSERATDPADAVSVAADPSSARPRGQHDRRDAILAGGQLRRRARRCGSSWRAAPTRWRSPPTTRRR